MFNQAFFSLCLPLHEDLCPCVMLSLSSGSPGFRQGHQTSPLHREEFFYIFLHLKTCLPPPLTGSSWCNGAGGECTWKLPVPTGVTSHPQCPRILGVHLEVSGKSLAVGSDSAGDFLMMSLLPVGQSRLGPVGWAAVAVVPMCPLFPQPFHRAFSKPTHSELCRTSLAFWLFSPMSPHPPDLYLPKDPLFLLQELLTKVVVRQRLFYSSFSSLKPKLQNKRGPGSMWE